MDLDTIRDIRTLPESFHLEQELTDIFDQAKGRFRDLLRQALATSFTEKRNAKADITQPVVTSACTDSYKEYVKKFKGNVPKWFKPDQWYHLPFEVVPEQYLQGRIEGTRKELSACLRPNGDDRELERRAGGLVWVRRLTRNMFEAFFRDASLYDFAHNNWLTSQSKSPE